MYKEGYTVYGLKILTIISPEKKVLNDRTHYKYFNASYYIEIDKYHHVKFWEYQLNSLITERKDRCKQIIKFAQELKIKLMLD